MTLLLTGFALWLLMENVNLYRAISQVDLMSSLARGPFSDADRARFSQGTK